MKIEQEQAKKLGLGAIVFVGVLYCYFTYLLGPLQAGERNATNGIAALGPQIQDANKQIRKTADLEKQAPAATAFLANLKNSIPDGEPIAWFPPKMADFFKNHGIEKCTTHLVSEAPDAMPGFRKLIWNIDVPRAEFVPLGVALSDLENQEPLLDVMTVTVDAAREDAQYQHATLVISTLVKS